MSGEAARRANARREWARVAHDALHELERLLGEHDPADLLGDGAEMLARAHDAIHKAVDDIVAPSETTTSDLRPFDRAFCALAAEHEVQAVWIAAADDGILRSGGQVELNEAVNQIMAAGMHTLGGQTPEPPPEGPGPASPERNPRLWTPGDIGNGSRLVFPPGADS